jgi:Asp/Glu/hydantoin racemase
MARIALIHALSHSIIPINTSFKQIWPSAQLMNLLDDSLSADLASNGKGLDDAMHERFMKLGTYAVNTGCDGILFTCSAFGSCIEAVARAYPNIPVLKPNEAMIAQAIDLATKIAEDAKPQAFTLGLISSFAPTLESMPKEFPSSIKLQTALVTKAMDALNAGDTAVHDRLVVEAAIALKTTGVKAIALAQFSMARARSLVEQATQLPVLTTTESAVRFIQKRVAN